MNTKIRKNSPIFALYSHKNFITDENYRREQRTAEQMIRIYCLYKEGNKELCPTCRQLLQYAHNRLKHCTFGEQKKTCRNCPIHCYKPEMKKRIQEVMRYAGPRMFFFHPITTIKHFIHQ